MKKNRTLIALSLLSLCLSGNTFAAEAAASKVKAKISKNASYYAGEMVIEGDYMLNPEVIKEAYKTPVGRFGTFQTLMPGEAGDSPMKDAEGKNNMVLRELHYEICKDGTTLRKHQGNGKLQGDSCKKIKNKTGVGIRPIPIVDGNYDSLSESDSGKAAKTANIPVMEMKDGKLVDTGETQEIKGSEELDKFLRGIYHYSGEQKKTGPIYSIIAYNHPENPLASFMDVGSDELLKTESGITHLGVYIGKGHTRNSPTNYHNYSWQVKGYPAAAYTVQYQGASSQAIFNDNAQVTVQILNEMSGGPEFPGDYKFDNFRSVNLKEILAFYRAWLDNDWKRPGVGITENSDGTTTHKTFFNVVKESELYHTYCAEHIYIALNVALNLAQNEQGYKDVYGEETGAQLWQLAVKRWKTDRKVGVSYDDGTDLVGRIPEGDSVYTPLWKLENIKNPTEVTNIGKSLSWAPETTSDLLRDYLSQYANWQFVSPVLSSAVVMGFAPVINERTGKTEQYVLDTMMPAFLSMYKHYAAFQLSKEAEKNELLRKFRDGKVALPEKDCKSWAAWFGCKVDDLVDFGAEKLGNTQFVQSQLGKQIKKGLEEEKAFSQVLEKYEQGLQLVIGKMDEQVQAGMAEAKSSLGTAEIALTKALEGAATALPKAIERRETLTVQKIANDENPDIAPALSSAEELDLADLEQRLKTMEESLLPTSLVDATEEQKIEAFLKADFQGQNLYEAVKGFSAAVQKAEVMAKAIELRKNYFLNSGDENSMLGKLSGLTDEVYELTAQMFKEENLNERMAWAYSQFQSEVKDALKEGRKAGVEISFEEQYRNTEATKQVEYYSAPAAIYRVVNGIHKGHPRVHFKAVATVMDASEIIKVKDSKRVVCDPKVVDIKTENLLESCKSIK